MLLLTPSMSIRRRNRIGRSVSARRELESGSGRDLQLLDEEQEQELADAIRKNRSSYFGLVKLAPFDLNNRSRQGAGPTLITLSSRLQRDQITSSLLRAGADPSVDATQSPPDYDLLTALWRLPTAYAVYLVNLHTKLVSIQPCMPSVGLCEVEHKGGETHVGPNPIVILPTCECRICSRCFWGAVKCSTPVRECRCPVCKTPMDEGNDLLPGTGFPWMAEAEAEVREGPQLTLEQLAAEIERLFSEEAVDTTTGTLVGVWSHKRWLALPSVDSTVTIPPPQPSSNNATKNKNKSFSAQTLRAHHSRGLGRTRSQRTEQLFESVLHGNMSRVALLVAEGVSLEERNTYGHTSLFVAAWRGHSKIAGALRLLGAQEAADFLGVTPQSVQLLLPPGAGAREETMEGLAWGCNPSPPKITTIFSFAKGSDPQAQGVPLAHFIDGAFTDELVQFLSALPRQIPLSPAEKPSCSDRFYWSDTLGVLSRAVECALSRVREKEHVMCRGIFPHMRFLEYRSVGGVLPPHIDLSRTEHYFTDDGECTSLTSTHTFLLYLSDCLDGGETALLHQLAPAPGDDNTICAVKPVMGRLFFFPHSCPHEGRLVECVPKLLVRGEMV